MTKPNTLSKTARALLTAAATRDDRLALPPERLPAAARRAVVQSLLKTGLLEELPADDDRPAWRTTEDGERLALTITDAGLLAIAGQPADSEAEAPQSPPEAAETAGAAPHAAAPAAAAQDARAAAQQADTRPTLRAAAQAVLAAWEEESRPGLPDAIAALRASLAKAPAGRSTRSPSGTQRAPRTDTKHAAVLALLRRPEGASGPAMAEATGWAPHTVRGFLAGLAKKGITVTVLDRVRQVGPGKEGAKGSYTVYRIGEGG